jgi:hypothetical protein
MPSEEELEFEGLAIPSKSMKRRHPHCRVAPLCHL